ncbi:hypothetical protein HZH68_017019 [Vespula germanica]|uniref:Uncharacterized protein n=1 Tax=Vespula germanica TaxID=30212 RepID=A0A834MPM2_VESGE|nr:hypothetical protein HZH68_017019 [Vespula germanica]
MRVGGVRGEGEGWNRDAACYSFPKEEEEEQEEEEEEAEEVEEEEEEGEDRLKDSRRAIHEPSTKERDR